MSVSGYTPSGPVGRIVHRAEEIFIALILGAMTLITFANVVLRYGFSESLLWGQEVVEILFAWLVLFGISYGFKVTAHLGVDAIVNMVGGGLRRAMALIACAVCVAYAFLLLKGAYDFWAPFANLYPTSGRWFPTGFEEARAQGYAVVRPVPIPFGKEFLENTFNWYMDGDTRVVEEYDYLPRVVPYLILPIGAALLFFRVVQATLGVIRGTRQRIITSHEAEDAVETAAEKLARGETVNRG